MVPSSTIDYLRRLLETYTLVIVKDNKIKFHSKDKTIRPIMDAVDTLRDELRNAIVADRVVGRAVVLVIANYPQFLYMPGC